ncbi:MAG: hypothetical protein ABL308_00900 [Oceanicaulis sp.]
MSADAPRPSLLAETLASARGVWRMLTFRSDWKSYFNVTETGVARSFLGVVLALPAFALLVASVNHFAAENPAIASAEARITGIEALAIWARFWLVFPVLAAIMAMVLNVRGRFASWLVAHNWAVFVLIHLQAAYWALYAAGLADAQALGSLVAIYQMVRLYVHWRVAHAALGLPIGLSTLAAAVPLIADYLIMAAL